MTVKDSQFWEMKTDADKLFYRTSFYRTERTSVLHSGIYNKEFTSMLFSGSTSLMSYMFTDFMANKYSVLRYIIVLLVFLISFIVARNFIFKEHYLEVIFNKTDQTVFIKYPGLFPKQERINFKDISSIEVGSKKYAPENIDGINFVQKISIQHGGAVPGLGQEEEYITVFLKVNNKANKIIFACRTNAGPDLPLNEIRNFLGHTA